MGVGGNSIPMETPKSYGDFSTAVSARSWGGPKMGVGGGVPKWGLGVSKWGVGAPRSHWRPQILWGFQHRGQSRVMGGVPWGLGGGGPKMEGGGLKMGVGGSQNRGWGHLNPIGGPKILWGFQHHGQRQVMGGGGHKMEVGGLKMGVGGTSIPMETPKSYGDFSTAVSATSWWGGEGSQNGVGGLKMEGGVSKWGVGSP